MSELKSKTLHALSWTFLESLGQRGIQFVVSIVMARLLLPEQFGIIGMLTVFMAVAQSLLDSGFGSALIQKKEMTTADICSIFYFNIVVGAMVALILCLSAPLVAGFYKQPSLTPLLRALSAVVVIDSFGLIQNTLLRKVIDFKTQAKINIFAVALSGSIGIVLAIKGYGVWSLAVQQVSNSFFRNIFLWVFNSWRPSLIFSLHSLKSMFTFGSRILGSGLLNTVFDNVYLVVIGKLFSASQLGFYSRANNLQQLPTMTLATIVGRVTFPVFSTIQDDTLRLKRGVQKALRYLLMINFPMMIGLAAVARPLVITLLTNKWAPCIPYLRLLCFVGLLYPLHLINLNVLMAMGRSDLVFRLEIIKKVLIVLNIVIMWRWGIKALIYGQIVLNVLSYYLNSYYNGILLKYPLWEQVQDLFPYLGISALMGIAMFFIGKLSFPNILVLLLAQVFSGAAFYTGLCLVLRLSAFVELSVICLNKMTALRIKKKL
jgi:teichuronic acid exporter